MDKLIEPRVLKGFRDFLPEEEIERRALIEKVEASFRNYGFVPIDTPALEYAEILLGKSGGEAHSKGENHSTGDTEKQMYRFTDHGGRDVALHFDLTVPFARFLAEHHSKLAFPFKRYHIGKAWRGENPQRGRYREFIQCDFDTIGSYSPSSDFEILHIMHQILSLVAGSDFTIRINHRGIFNHLLSGMDIPEKSPQILRTVDKLSKIGSEKCHELLSEITIHADKIMEFIQIKGDFDETLNLMTEIAGSCEGTENLNHIRNFINDAGISSYFVLDPSITRGLDYYTGIVFESFINKLPDIGSVCSGGRYDNLVGLYSRVKMPGVGASLGLDRLLASFELLGKKNTRASYAHTAIACVNSKSSGRNQLLASMLRKEGINCDVFLDEEDLVKQFKTAEKKGIKYIIIPSNESLTEDDFTIRDLSTRKNTDGLKLKNLIDFFKRLILD